MSRNTYASTAVFHENGPEAIVYIHGGAWIDVKNTPMDFQPLSEHVKRENNILSQYAIEYRLSPAVKHPEHLYDCLHSLYKLIEEKGIQKLHLLGHSVGATLCWQIMTFSPDSCIPPPQMDIQKIYKVQSMIGHTFLVSGIFSLRELLEEYPRYDYFVSQAYKSVDDFDDPANSVSLISKEVYLHIVHSYEDELLTLRQSNYLSSLLQSKELPYRLYVDDLGKHEDVYAHAKLARYIVLSLN